MKRILCQWLGLWLTSEHVGRVFEVGYTPQDRGLTDDETSAYLLFRSNPLQATMTGTHKEWEEWASEAPWLLALAMSNEKSHAEGSFDPEGVPKNKRGLTVWSEYRACLDSSSTGCSQISFYETEKGVHLSRYPLLSGTGFEIPA